ncbi:Phenylalanyl-tRNA synthetase alpha subunit [Geobacillus proteiniphilus]|uniref:Phenylalanyl-tRNA synthetase alpha subunit n=4 Tax=Geobacillus TaxID=129337 RepID=A0A1Q5T1P1_9BACL|nr:Phenylalanyl-tRNA synthetase alpha subunit [Geobacillus proteiniphilus]
MISCLALLHTVLLGGRKMKFENTGLENQTVELSRLDDIMERLGFVRAAQWDYERVTYDRKYVVKEGTYYLRVQGYAIEGDVDSRYALIKLLTPILGKHYYPHGVEYGDDEHFPSSLVSQCQNVLAQVKSELEKIKE